MKNLKLFLFQLLIVATLASCTAYNGLTYNVNSNQTQVHLSTDNYKIIKYVEGKSTSKYLFGIGGGNKQGMIARAREEMLKNANLKGKSRAVINETVEIKARQIFIYTEFTYIVSAYIVEFYSDPSNEPKVEDDVFISREIIDETTVKQTKLSAGTLTMNLTEPIVNNRSFGFFGSYAIEFSKPISNKNWFWELQTNLMYIQNNYSLSNFNYYNSELITYGIEIPVLIGYRVNLSPKTLWFAKAGLGLGYYIERSYYYDGGNNVDDQILPLLELQTGFSIGKKWDVFAGYKHAFAYGDYDIAKIGVSYKFNK